jgi:hypothetical protein
MGMQGGVSMLRLIIILSIVVTLVSGIVLSTSSIAKATTLGTPKAATPGPSSGTMILEGKCVKIGVKPNGTLGIGNSTQPGIQYDKTCSGTFNGSYDFLTPGIPWENLNVKLGEINLNLNNQNGSASRGTWPAGTMTLIDKSGVPYRGTQYDNRVVAIFTSTVATMENDIRFNDYDQFVDISTYVTPTIGVEVGYISRAIDSDARIGGSDSSATNNARGYSEIPKKYLVFSETTVSKAVMGYYTGEDGADVNTGISSGWSMDSTTYHAYSGADVVPDADYTIGIAKKFTMVAARTAMVFHHAYIFGDSAYNGAEPAIRTGAGGGVPGVIPGCPGCVLTDSGSALATNTPNPAGTNTPRPTNTSAPISGPTYTPSRTLTPSRTSTHTVTATYTTTNTPTITNTRTATATRTLTASMTATSTRSLTATRSSTATMTASVTRSSTRTLTATVTRSATATATSTRTNTFTRTVTNTRTNTPSQTATNTPKPQTLKKAAIGNLFILGLLSNGSLVTWGGKNEFGETSIPSIHRSKIFVDVATTVDTAFALDDAGNLFAWGGTPKYNVKNIPTNARTGVKAIGSGANFVVAVKTDGSLVAWGEDSYSQVTNVPRESGFVAVDGGPFHACAIKSDTTVKCWGDNRSGHSKVPAGLTGVTAISAGQDHTVALLSNGTLVGWGSNLKSQIRFPADLTGVIDVAAGRMVTIAVMNDGTIKSFGDPQYFNFGSPAISNAVAVASDNQNSIVGLSNNGVRVAGLRLTDSGINVSRSPTRTASPTRTPTP